MQDKASALKASARSLIAIHGPYGADSETQMTTTMH